MPRIERGILRRDGIKPLRQWRARLGQALPAIGWRRHICGWRQRRLVDHLPRHRNDIIVLRALHRITRRAIERRSLVAGTLSEDAAQAQEDEDRQRQEDDGINIHVVFAFWSLTTTAPGGTAFPLNLRERQRRH